MHPVASLPIPSLIRPSAAVVAAALLAAASPRGLEAQRRPPVRDTGRDTAQAIQTVVVRARRAPAVVGGAAAQLVRPDSLRLDASPTLADALRRMPLLHVRSNSRGELELSARGSESRQVGVLLEGLPLSVGWDGRADASLIPLSGVTQLTYVRGLGTLLAGPNTLGGTVELSLDDPTAPAGVAPRVSVGSDQTGARLTSLSATGTTVGEDGDRLQWQVGGGYRQRDGVVRAGGVVDVLGDRPALRRNTDGEQLDGFARLAWRSRSGARLGGLVAGYDAKRGVAPELHVDDPRLWRYPEQRRVAALVTGATPRAFSRAGITQLEASAGVLRGRTAIERFGSATYDVVTGTESGDEDVLTARALARHIFPTGAQLRVGTTWLRTRYDERLGDDAPATYEQRLLSVGAEAEVPVGTRAVLSGGVVRDAATTPRAGGRALQPDQSAVGWRLGATFRARDEVRWHASASRRARFPALRELYSGALDRFEVNPTLTPETLLASEVGVTVTPDPVRGAVLQATAFHHWLDDGVVRITVPETRRFRRVNRDETRSLGLELVTGWRGGPGRPSLLLDLVAQRVRVRDALGGGAADRPEHQPALRALLDGTLPLGRDLLLGASVQHVGSQFCLDPARAAPLDLAGRTVGNLTVSRQWRLSGWGAFRALRALVGLDNVSNVALYEQCGLPRAGRTLRVGFDLR